VPERGKRARPIVIVFEEEPRCSDALENRHVRVSGARSKG
jgi:hypothetical protein